LVPSRGGLRDVPVDGVDVGSVEFVVLVVMSVSSFERTQCAPLLRQDPNFGSQLHYRFLEQGSPVKNRNRVKTEDYPLSGH
jgi:hypothetical protein